MRARTKAALAAGSALLLSVAAQTAARAAGDDSYVSISPDYGARAIFESNGEVFRLYDDGCDGQVPRLQYKKGSNGAVTSVENRGGCHGDVNTINESWAENTVIYFRACNVSAAGSNCDSWHKATA